MTVSTSPPHPTPGASAPDCILARVDGSSVSLSSIWKEGQTALVFLRHLGCVFCREQVAVLRQGYTKLQDAGVSVVCIAQGNAQTGKAFSLFFDLPFPLLLCGDDLSVYTAYGLARGTTGQLFGLRSWARGFAAVLHGRAQGKLVGDGFQLGGVFVVDEDGIVRWAHPCMDAADIVSAEDILSGAKYTVEQRVNI